MDDHLVYTKMDILQTTFLQIILDAKQLLRHSSTFPNQQRRPLPSMARRYVKQQFALFFKSIATSLS